MKSIDRLVVVLRQNPKAMRELLVALGIPCEGFQGPCNHPAEVVTPSMTSYPDKPAEGELGPNRDRYMCSVCSEGYIQMMQDQWDEYYAGRL